MSIQDAIITKKRYELVATAKAMIEGDIHLIEGIRKICELRNAIDQPNNEVFMPIRAIESETDHFPLGEIRAHCAGDYLQRMDTEMNQYLAEASQDIFSACRKIIHIFSASSNPQPLARTMLWGQSSNF